MPDQNYLHKGQAKQRLWLYWFSVFVSWCLFLAAGPT